MSCSACSGSRTLAGLAALWSEWVGGCSTSSAAGVLKQPSGLQQQQQLPHKAAQWSKWVAAVSAATGAMKQGSVLLQQQQAELVQPPQQADSLQLRAVWKAGIHMLACLPPLICWGGVVLLKLFVVLLCWASIYVALALVLGWSGLKDLVAQLLLDESVQHLTRLAFLLALDLALMQQHNSSSCCYRCTHSPAR